VKLFPVVFCIACVKCDVARLPKYASKFIEMCLMVTADHGPAVSGAHNTIVCARAGKDLISSLASGLLTIVSQPFNLTYSTDAVNAVTILFLFSVSF